MKRKLNAKLLTLFLLIGALICAVFAYFAINHFSNFTAQAEDNSTTIERPEVDVKTTVTNDRVMNPKWSNATCDFKVSTTYNKSTITVEYSPNLSEQTFTFQYEGKESYISGGQTRWSTLYYSIDPIMVGYSDEYGVYFDNIAFTNKNIDLTGGACPEYSSVWEGTVKLPANAPAGHYYFVLGSNDYDYETGSSEYSLLIDVKQKVVSPIVFVDTRSDSISILKSSTDKTLWLGRKDSSAEEVDYAKVSFYYENYFENRYFDDITVKGNTPVGEYNIMYCMSNNYLWSDTLDTNDKFLFIEILSNEIVPVTWDGNYQTINYYKSSQERTEFLYGLNIVDSDRWLDWFTDDVTIQCSYKTSSNKYGDQSIVNNYISIYGDIVTIKANAPVGIYEFMYYLYYDYNDYVYSDTGEMDDRYLYINILDEPSFSYGTVTYGQNSSTPSVSNNAGGGAQSWSLSNGTGAATINSSTGVINKPTKAGTVNVTLNIGVRNNYRATSVTKAVTVSKASYNMSNAKWNYTSAFTYDGTAKTVSVTGLPSGVTVKTYSNNSKTDAGTYTASVTSLNYDTTNYNAPSFTTTCSWTINKASISDATVTLGTNSYTYDGSVKTPSVTSVVKGSNTVPSSDYTVSYSNNTNAGTDATVTITVKTTSTNYTGTATKTFTIGKATPVLTASVVDGTYYIGRELSTVGIECDNPDGAIDWTDGSIILTANGTYAWTFVPEDTANYNNATGNLNVTAVGELDSITVSGIGIYKAYESFTTSGLTVTAHYLGGVADATVSADNCTITIPYTDGNTYFLVADSGSNVAFEYAENGITVDTEVEITVIKADYDLSSVRMDDITEPYNKQEKSITIAGTLPTGLNGGKSGLEVLYYTYNLTQATGRTNVGEYEVVAVLNNLDEANYNTPVLKATLNITKATPKVTVTVATGTYFVGDLLGNIGIIVDESDTNGSVSWSNGALTLTDGGSYGWTFVPDDTANYNNATGFASVKVSFKVVSIRVYNAIINYSAYDEFDTTGMVVEATYAAGKTPTAVEGWTFSYPGSTKYFLVADDGKSMTVYYSEGGNDVTTTVEIHVVKKTVDMSEVEMEDEEETYNGSPWSITAENLPDGVQVDHYTYNGETATGVKDADTYTVVAVFKVTDTANVEVPANKTAQLIINRAEAEFDTDDLQTVYTYSGETITIDSGVTVNNTEQTVVYTNNEFKYVSDSGKLVVSVEQSKNYNKKSIEIPITIEKAQLSLTWNGEETPYDGKVHSAVLEVAGAVGEDIGVITTENFGALITVNYTGPDAERKKAGVYTPELNAFPETSPYDNYSYVITNTDYTLKILDGVLNITFTSDSVPYDGETHELFAQNVPDEVQVTYYYKNTTDLFTGVKDVHYASGVVAGYEITAKFACSTGNYTVPADMHATLTITPREIAEDEVSGILETYTYKGSAWTPAPVVALQLVEGGNVETLTKGEDYTVSYSTEDFNAGTNVTVQVKGSGNYGGKVEIPFTIVKALLGLEWQEGEYTYNGAGQGVTATLTGVAEVDKDTVTLTHAYEGVGDTHYSGADLPVNAGDYLVTVSLGELANYETFSSRSRNFKIKKADVQVKVRWESYDESVDELYEGSSVPTLKLDGTPKLGDIEVTGSLVCQHTALIFGENEYIWIFTPNDSQNFNTVYVKKILNSMNAKISAIHVGWRDGTMPSIYVSTTLDEIRDYLEITCDLTGRTDTIILDKSAEYTVSGNWDNSGDTPKFGNATYVLTVRYNGKVDTIDAYYIALDYSLKVDKVEGFKTEYKGLDEFDRTSIKVTAVRNDGVEEVVTDYTITYVSGNALWVGDTYITISYDANGTLEKPIEREVNGIRVIPKDYDISGIYFPENSSVEYDGTSKSYTVTGVFEDGEISYTYAKRNSSGVFESCTADDLTDVGTYRITARFTLIGDAYLANYYRIDPIYSELSITPADCAAIVGLTDVTVDYDNGNSLAEKVRIANLPDGVTGVNYAYVKNGTPVSENEVVDAGEYVVTVSFEVDANHNAIMPRTVKLIINKVEPNVSKPVVSGSLSAGTKLGDLFFDELDGVKGTFVWDNAEQVLKAGMNRCAYTFTPDDTTNYKVVRGYLDLTISGSSATEGQGGTNNAGSSTAMLVIMAVALVVVLVIAIAALKIAVSKGKSGGGDSDGFYDDVTPEDLQ